MSSFQTLSTPTFHTFLFLPYEIQHLIWTSAYYPAKRAHYEHTRAHAEAVTLKGLELDGGFLNPRRKDKDYIDT